MATSNRLGDLQISKIKRRANINLSISELLNSKWDLGFLSGIFLSWDAQNLQWSSQPQLAGGCEVFIDADPNGEISKVTRCDSLMRVHNGRNFNQCALLEEQES